MPEQTTWLAVVDPRTGDHLAYLGLRLRRNPDASLTEKQLEGIKAMVHCAEVYAEGRAYSDAVPAIRIVAPSPGEGPPERRRLLRQGGED